MHPHNPTQWRDRASMKALPKRKGNGVVVARVAQHLVPQ